MAKDFSFGTKAPSLIDLTAGMGAPPVSNTRIPARGYGRESDDTDKFGALYNEEMQARLQDERIGNEKQALYQKVKELYDAGDEQAAQQLSVQGMMRLKMAEVQNQTVKNTMVNRQKMVVENVNKISQDDQNRVYLHSDGNGNFVPVYNPETGRMMTNAEVGAKALEGNYIDMVKVKDKNGNEHRVAAFKNSTSVNQQTGALDLAPINVAFNKYTDWDKQFVELFRSKEQLERKSFGKEFVRAGKLFMEENTYASDKSNIDNAFKSSFLVPVEVKDKKGRKSVQYQFSLDKMLGQMSDQERQSFYQDYYSSRDYRKGVGADEFAARRMKEISKSEIDVTKDAKDYKIIDLPTDSNGKEGDNGITETEARINGQLAITSQGSITFDKNGQIPFVYNNGAVDKSRSMDPSLTSNSYTLGFLQRYGQQASQNTSIPNGHKHLRYGNVYEKSDKKVLSGKTLQHFSPPTLNPNAGLAIGWSTIDNNDENSDFIRNPVNTGFAFSGVNQNTYRLPNFVLAGGVSVDVPTMIRKAGNAIKDKQLCFVEADATTAQWVGSKGQRQVAAHGMVLMPKDAAKMVYNDIKLYASKDYSNAIHHVNVFKYNGKPTEEGKAYGVFYGTVKEWLVKKYPNIKDNYGVDPSKLTKAQKISYENFVTTVANAGYGFDDKIVLLPATAPVKDPYEGVEIINNNNTYDKSTAQTKRNMADRTSNFE